MLLNTGDVDVSVGEGCVVLRGQVSTQEDAEILVRCVRRIPGVLEVETELRWHTPDSRRALLGFRRF